MRVKGPLAGCVCGQTSGVARLDCGAFGLAGPIGRCRCKCAVPFSRRLFLCYFATRLCHCQGCPELRWRRGKAGGRAQSAPQQRSSLELPLLGSQGRRRRFWVTAADLPVVGCGNSRPDGRPSCGGRARARACCAGQARQRPPARGRPSAISVFVAARTLGVSASDRQRRG